MPDAVRPLRWLSAHPLGSDVLLAGLVLAFTLGIASPAEGRLILAPLDPSSVVLSVLSCAALVLRRRAPWWVWATTTVLGVTGVVLAGGSSRVLIPAIVGLYTLATLVRPREAVAAALVNAFLPVAIILASNDVSLLAGFAYGFGPWSGLAAVTGIAVRNQRAVVAAAHERARQAEESREENARRMVYEERLRIARDLHDVVAHHIAVINVQAGVAAHLMRSDPDQAGVALAHVREAGREVLEEVPGLLGLLRSPEDEMQTAPAPRLADLGELVEQSRRSGLQATTRLTGSPLPLSPAVELTAYRVLQEALTNAARHGTGSATVTVAYDPGGCTLEVRNRRGESREGAGSGGQHGLTGMRERAAWTGGELTVGPDGADDWLVRYRVTASPAGEPA